MRLTASDGDLTNSDETTVTVVPANQPPVVSAGLDQEVDLPAPAQLHGMVTDDGLPPSGSLTSLWTRVSGPGAVVFGDALQPNTPVFFPMPGDYLLRLTAGDGEFSAQDELTVTARIGPACMFPGNLVGWNVTASGPGDHRPSGADFVPGSVVPDPNFSCAALMTEGDSFLVGMERSWGIPANSNVLSVTYQLLNFDTSATNLMRDAFELAVLDDTGRPLTFTVQGADGVTASSAQASQALPPVPDACFNLTELQPPFAAPGISVPSVNSPFSTVNLDLHDLAAGQSVRLLLRLVNNDFDRSTAVRITDVHFQSADSLLDFSGTPGTALSLVGASEATPSAETAPPAFTFDDQASQNSGGNPLPVTFIPTSAPPAVVTFFDGDLPESRWTNFTWFGDDPYQTVRPPGTSTATNTLEETGGNPGAYRKYVIDIVAGDTGGPVALNNAAVYDPAVSGAISSIDFRADLWQWSHYILANYTPWSPTIEQDGKLFFLVPWVLFYYSSGWLPYEKLNATEADFDTNPYAYTDGIPPDGVHPDFSATGSPFKFGYMLWTYIIAGKEVTDHTVAIDNWFVRITPQQYLYPPTLAIESPRNHATLLTGSVQLAGFASVGQSDSTEPGTAVNRIVQVSVNGHSVEALDAAGNFFDQSRLCWRRD